MPRRLLMLALLLLPLAGVAQFRLKPDSLRKSVFALGLRGHYGYLLAHSEDMVAMKGTRPWGVEADFGWQLVSESAYRFCSCYPRVGLTTTYFHFDQGTVLGSAAIAAAYVEPVFFQPRKFNLSFRLAIVGVAYLSHPYDPETNPDNVAYSMPISFPLIVGFGLNYKVDKHWNLRLGGNFNHLSNGGIKKPNRGLNFPTILLGAEYAFHPVDMPNRGRLRREPPEKKNRFEFDLGQAVKNATQEETGHHWVGVFSMQYSRWAFRSVAFGGGMCLELDYSRRERIRRSEDPARGFERFSLYGGYEFWLGRLRFSQMVGLYLHDEFREEDPRWYHRTELNIHAFPWLFFGVSLKAHHGRADYLDIKMGYSLAWKDGLVKAAPASPW